MQIKISPDDLWLTQLAAKDPEVAQAIGDLMSEDSSLQATALGKLDRILLQNPPPWHYRFRCHVGYAVGHILYHLGIRRMGWLVNWVESRLQGSVDAVDQATVRRKHGYTEN